MTLGADPVPIPQVPGGADDTVGMRTFFLRSAGVTAALLLVAGLSACGGSDQAGEELAERIAEKATGGKVDIDRKGERVTIRGEDGDATVDIGSGKRPGDFPDEVPLPDGKIVSSVTGSTPDGKTWSLSIKVDDPLDAIDDYRKDLEAKGFEITNSFESSGATANKTFVASNGTWNVTASASKAAAGADATLVVGVTPDRNAG